jgi:hypothetical protein
VAADVGATMRLQVTATNAIGSTVAVSSPTAAVAPAALPPASTVLPSIAGTAQVGQLLTGSQGLWSGAPTGFVNQWLRCNAGGSSCINMTGQTGMSYTPLAFDVGATLRFQVTASNAAGSTVAVSSPTVAVGAAASAAVLGNALVGSSTVRPSAGYKFGSVFTLAQAGTLVDFRFYMAGGSAAQKFTPLLYNVVNGLPTTLVTKGAEVTVAAGGPPGWLTSTLPALSLAPGSYMLALLSGPAAFGATMYYTTASDAKAGHYNINAYPTPSATWGTTQYENHLNSFYIDYTR